MSDLLPCPFCGGSGNHYCDEGQGHYVACTRCGACGIVRHNDNAATKEWNTRGASAALNIKITAEEMAKDYVTDSNLRGSNYEKYVKYFKYALSHRKIRGPR